MFLKWSAHMFNPPWSLQFSHQAVSLSSELAVFCFPNATSNFQSTRAITLFSIILTALTFKENFNKFLFYKWMTMSNKWEFRLPPINLTLEISRCHWDTSFLNGGSWPHRVTTWNVGGINYVAPVKGSWTAAINWNCFWPSSPMLHGATLSQLWTWTYNVHLHCAWPDLKHLHSDSESPSVINCSGFAVNTKFFTLPEV